MENTEKIGILAIKTNSPEYKITYAFEKKLNASVKIAKEYSGFSVYRVKLQKETFLLINNKSEKKYFFPKLKEFYFIIKCNLGKVDFIKENIKKIDEIIFVMKINIEDLPKKYLKTLSLLD